MKVCGERFCRQSRKERKQFWEKNDFVTKITSFVWKFWFSLADMNPLKERQRYYGSISSTFYVQLLHAQSPKLYNDTDDLSVFFTLSGSRSVKAARRTLVKLTLWGGGERDTKDTQRETERVRNWQRQGEAEKERERVRK